MDTRINSIDTLRNHEGPLSLDVLDGTFFNSLNNPYQPNKSNDIDILSTWFTKELALTMNCDIENKHDCKKVNDLQQVFERIYGGSIRFYERFLIARNHNLSKTKKMMKQMLETRKRILGEYLVSSIGMSGDINDKGREDEKELFSSIDKFWAIEYFGFTAQKKVLLTAKLNGIQPGKFIKKFKKSEIEKYYFHFLETGCLLLSVSNSAPCRSHSKETSFVSSKMHEIYDFNGIGKKQLSMQGLMVLKDVLSLGQVVFPEETERTLMINTPWFFSTCWSLVSIVLDKKTKEKIAISRHGLKDKVAELSGGADGIPLLWHRVIRKIA